MQHHAVLREGEWIWHFRWSIPSSWKKKKYVVCFEEGFEAENSEKLELLCVGVDPHTLQYRVFSVYCIFVSYCYLLKARYWRGQWTSISVLETM